MTGIEWFPIVKDLLIAIYTLIVGVAAYAYKQGQKRMDKLEASNEMLTKDLNNVKLQYLEKTEIEKIESRIDRRFDEMRVLVLSLIEKVKQ